MFNMAKNCKKTLFLVVVQTTGFSPPKNRFFLIIEIFLLLCDEREGEIIENMDFIIACVFMVNHVG